MPIQCVGNKSEMSVDLLQDFANTTSKPEPAENCPSTIVRLNENSGQVATCATSVDMVCFENGFGPDRKHGHFVGVRRNVIPYSDHNYGQPPPLTPPEPCSPDHNEQTDTGNEDEDEEGVTKCICGFSHDDGYMICCDKCSTWQHIECMGISSNAVPEKYSCDRCQPRVLDVERAKAIQRKKREENSGDDDNDDTESDDEGVASYTAVSSTPTRITLTANASTNKKKSRWRLPGNRLTQNQNQKTSSKHVRRRKKKFSDCSPDGEFLAFWEMSCLDKYYQSVSEFKTITKCRYESGLDVVLWQAPEGSENDQPVSIKDEMCCISKVSEGRKGLVAAHDIEKGAAIIELMGTVSLTPNFKGHCIARFCPFTVFYNELDHMEFMIDSRTHGNEARFVRRSCTWNALVRHKVIDGSLHFLLWSHKFIPMGEEIVIGFEHPISSYNSYLECACGLAENCPVTKHNLKFQATNVHLKAKLKALVQQHIFKPLPGDGQNQADTDSDDNNEVNVDSVEKPSVVRRKQLSREDRKLQTYLKQIEKMEKKEQKPRDVKQGMQRPSIEELQGTGNAVKEKMLAASKRYGGKRKMSLSKGKRPRLSSCSSEPLSPDVDVTTTQTTVLHSSMSAIDFPNRQRFIKRDRPNGPVPSLLSLDKHHPGPFAKRLKHEEIDTALQTGSPTPPSTPGQLSPSGRGLSVQTDNQQLIIDGTTVVSPFANSVLSHTSPSSSLDGRKLSVGSLLQVAIEPSDSSCSSVGGSPHPARVIATTGAATCEEKIGDLSRCDSSSLDVEALRMPVTPLRHTSEKSSSYCGSLKKRWLQRLYYGCGAIDSGLDSGHVHTISLASLMTNSLLHAKMALTQSTQQSNAALYRLPLKKRRLKTALSDVLSDDVLSGPLDDDVAAASTVGQYRHDRPKLSLSSFLMSTNRSSSKPSMRPSSTDASDQGNDEEMASVSAVDAADATESPKDNDRFKHSSLSYQLNDVSRRTDAFADNNNDEDDEDDGEGDDEDDSVQTDDRPTTAAAILLDRDDGEEKGGRTPCDATASDEHHQLPVSSNAWLDAPSAAVPTSDDAVSHSLPGNSTSVSVGSTPPCVVGADAHSPLAKDQMSRDEEMTSSEMRTPTKDPLGAIPQQQQEQTDSTTNHLERRDSVSSTSSDRGTGVAAPAGGGSGGKKKMSLSEYRNRQRARPAPSTPSPTVSSAPSSSYGQSPYLAAMATSKHPSTTSSPPHSLSTGKADDRDSDTLADSLLTPRTVSLSNSFSAMQQRKTSIESASSIADESALSRPMFEPVSPSNDFDDHDDEAPCSTARVSGDGVASNAAMAIGGACQSSASLVVHSLPGTVYMHGQTFCYSSVGSTGLPVSSLNLQPNSGPGHSPGVAGESTRHPPSRDVNWHSK